MGGTGLGTECAEPISFSYIKEVEPSDQTRANMPVAYYSTPEPGRLIYNGTIVLETTFVPLVGHGAAFGKLEIKPCT